MTANELIGVIADEAEKPLKNGLPVKVFFFRGPVGRVYLTMEAMTRQTHRHVPIRLPEGMGADEFRGVLRAARAALEAAEWG